MNFYSQHQEDKWIIENLNPAVGTYAEIGAFDGRCASNTMAFEELGWRGMLVEPDPYMAAQCQRNRIGMTWCCAAGKPRLTNFYIHHSDRGLSGLKSSGQRIPMVVVALEDLILNNGFFNRIDLLSIDTEGTELEVWESIGPIRPQIVIMEYKTCDEPSQEVPITERMTKDGYKLVHKTLCNLIFTR